jgi:hypothetical protein
MVRLAINDVLFMHRSRIIRQFLSALLVSEFETGDRPSGTCNKQIRFLFEYNLALLNMATQSCQNCHNISSIGMKLPQLVQSITSHTQLSQLAFHRKLLQWAQGFPTARWSKLLDRHAVHHYPQSYTSSYTSLGTASSQELRDFSWHEVILGRNYSKSKKANISDKSGFWYALYVYVQL